MSKRISIDEVDKILTSKNLLLKSDYTGLSKPITVECKICGNEWTTRANVVLRLNCSCPKCQKIRTAKKLSFTKETFMESCGKLGNNITMTGEYIGFQNKTKFYCNDCGYEWETTPYMIKKFKTCPNCTGNRKLTHEEYLQRVIQAHGENEYSILSEYKALSKKIKVKHNLCGNIFETNALNFIGTGRKKACNCPQCSHGSKLRTIDEFRKLLYEKDQQYEVIGEYTGNLNPIEIKHICGKVLIKRPYDILNRELLCPNCDKERIKMSLGERKIMDYLVENNTSYIYQEKLKECKDKKTLPFDFGIYDSDNKLVALIEYDGWQHYNYNNNGDSTFNYENYLKIKFHDEIKTDYCKKNNIPLLRIKYTDFNNIKEILDNFLKERSTTIENASKDESK